MADRFPSLDEFDAGESYSRLHPVVLLTGLGATKARGDGNIDLVGEDGGELDFEARERALLGDAADEFATGNDKLATVEDGDDDLLGGGSSYQANTGNEEMMGFESSFPAIDTSNEVRCTCFGQTAHSQGHRGFFDIEWTAVRTVY